MQKGFVYILTNHYNTVLYVGVTNDLERRIYEHKNFQGGAFTQKYKCHKLVYFAETDSIITAIEYEKKIKAGSRAKKNQLIEEENPHWLDLAIDWFDEEKRKEIATSFVTLIPRNGRTSFAMT